MTVKAQTRPDTTPSPHRSKREHVSITDREPQPLHVLDDAGRKILFTEARTANTFATTAVTVDELATIWELALW